MAAHIVSRPFEAVFAVLMAPLLLFFAAATIYQWRLLLAALMGIRRTPPEHPYETLRFLVIVPAHNEELVLNSTIQSLLALDYPAELRDIVVIADNCTDGTAEIARRAGASVIERHDTNRIGKGFALQDVISSGADSRFAHCDAIVIVDADTTAEPNLLRAFADGLERGEVAMQARYGVLNVDDSWRTRLQACALGLAHFVKPLGRERLGLSVGLKGNGMCFSSAIAVQAQWSGESITEDIAYTVALARQDVRVAFVTETGVLGLMPAGGRSAATQRRRWEGGRLALARTAPRLLREAIRTRNRILADAAIDLIIPPLSESIAAPTALLILSMAVYWRTAAVAVGAFALCWAAILAMMVTYIALGLRTARIPLRIARAMLAAPFYIVWKLALRVALAASRSARAWVRTERHQT